MMLWLTITNDDLSSMYCLWCVCYTGKPSPPVNLTHTQNAEGELVLSWSNPQPHASPVPLSYEVRYITSHNTSNPNWKVRTHWPQSKHNI